MKNFIQLGDVISVTAPATVASGAGVLVGSLFGVAAHAATSGQPVEIATKGVFSLAKTGGEAWTQGVRVYWSGTAVTTTVGTNKLIGVAAAAAASGDTVGPVLLSGAFTI